MNLTSENVAKVIRDCLLPREVRNIPTSIEEAKEMGFITVETVKRQIAFVPEKVEEHRQDIVDMLSQLDKSFFKEEGGGGSFLTMNLRADGTVWTGFHLAVDDLIALGMAIGKVSFVLPRNMWKILPGGVPYVSVCL